ncbi:hypothetical protein MF621_004143 (plasmid) [Bacillus velezensis]|uniref:hypothetical protein n=1 Tax=Bacillus velezensis TaxID=492670 RepID=UPI00049FDFCD|nr:hypothetical protein [Bacillus velezensis]KDN90469.1 hypothetical protein EF87_20800 [Bacillus amyloliquefaciens]URJ76436.1 hypothetical protein MF619_004009 [Bacillus velezensis]URJ80392.1 hypothetical protein MF621_004143 [Bacillus velezensis]
MGRRFKTVSELQKNLKNDILNSIKDKISEACVEIVRKNINDKVYKSYIPQGENSYDRTYELLDSVVVGNFKLGTKYAQFEIYMDSNRINPYVTSEGEWNKHVSFDPIDESEMIPLWIEEGTDGSLWDRDGAHYMEESSIQLDDSLYKELARELKRNGWEVKII